MAGKGEWQGVVTLVLAVLLWETSLRLPTADLLLQLVVPRRPVLPTVRLFYALVWTQLDLRVTGRGGRKLQIKIQIDAIRIKLGERREKAPTGRPAGPLAIEGAFASPQPIARERLVKGMRMEITGWRQTVAQLVFEKGWRLRGGD